jgi:hypothetical protein
MVVAMKVNRAAMGTLQRRIEKIRKDTRPAIASAVNDTLKQVRTQASKIIRGHIAMKKVDVDKRLRIRRARATQLNGIVWVSDREISLSRFKQRQGSAGVELKINKKGSLTVIPKSFGPKRPKLQGGVYRRQGKDRLPLEKVPGISLAKESLANGAIDATKQLIPGLLQKNVKRRLRLIELRASGQA